MVMNDAIFLENDRGLFILSVVRMIKEKLIYNDIKDALDEYMSDSQIGARPKRGIRDHLFVIYSIIHSVKRKEGNPIDIQMIDIRKCFDTLWLEECINNLFEAGIQDDILAMIFEGNSKNEVAVQTPVGITERIPIERIVMQGGVLGAPMCSLSIDKICKDSFSHKIWV